MACWIQQSQRKSNNRIDIRVFLIWIAISASLVTLLPTDARAQAPVPAWDYAMPDRFVDRNAALPDPQPNPAQAHDAYVNGALHPASWAVTFDACATAGLVSSYDWFIDDVLIESRSTCSGFQHAFPSEGTYDVRLVAVGTAGQIADERAIEINDLLLFGIGDSYGSGEGNPDVAIDDALISQYSDTADALAQANADADAAYVAWQNALAIFNPLVARVNTARAALNSWSSAVAHRNNVCSSFPFTGCVAAQAAATARLAELIVALANIGIPDPGSYSFGAILNSINNVYNAALATYNVAESPWLAASALVSDTAALLAQLEDLLIPEWQNATCHRSAFSGQVKAAKRIELADPHTSVTFIHLACSGATIIGGGKQDVIGPDQVLGGVVAAETVNPSYQVGLMRDLAGSRAVDGLFVSIGGNDAGFADIITKCVTTEPCHLLSWAVDAVATAALATTCDTAGFFIEDCAFDPPPLISDAETHFATLRAQLQGKYASLAGWLDGSYPYVSVPGDGGLGAVVAPDRVFITEYPDSSHDELVTPCDWDPSQPLDPTQLIGITGPEFDWFSRTMVAGIHDELQAAASAHGWNFVEGISAPFLPHGYCASDPWVVRIAETLVNQGDYSGMVHPDESGQDAYADALEDSYFVPEPSFGLSISLGVAAVVCMRRRGRCSFFGSAETDGPP